MNCQQDHGYLYLATAITLLGPLGCGTVIGYSGVAFSDMERVGSAMADIMSSSSARTWFSSLMAIGAFFGAIIASPLANMWGRRLTVIITSIPFIIGWAMVATARRLEVLYVGRWLCGVCVGMTCVTAPMYLSEVSMPKFRGLLGGLFGTVTVSGILITGFMGLGLHWEIMATVCAIIPFLLLIGSLLCTSESPKWLIAQNRIVDAQRSMVFLYGKRFDAEGEIATITKSSENSTQVIGFSMQEWKKPSVWKPALISVVLMMFQQCSGANSFMVYAVSIFQASGSSPIEPIWCVIIIQLTQVAITAIASLLVDHAGRRPLLLISAGTMSISLAVFATFRYLATVSEHPELYDLYFNWIPVVCLFMFIAGFSIGYGPIPWVMVPEMVPLSVRSIVSGAATLTNWTCFFVVTKMYDETTNLVGDYGVYFLYSASSACAFFFTLFCVPETKSKTIDDIRNLF